MRQTTRPGGHRRKAWRLKKKYKKWFFHILQTLMKDTLAMMPKNYFENVWENQTYDICRIFKCL